MPLRTADGRPYASALPRVRWNEHAVVADGICRYENRLARVQRVASPMGVMRHYVDRLAHVVMRHYGAYQ